MKINVYLISFVVPYYLSYMSQTAHSSLILLQDRSKIKPKWGRQTIRTEFVSYTKSLWLLSMGYKRTRTSRMPLISRPSSSLQFSHSVASNPLWPHTLQHARPPCPSPTPWVYSNSCTSSWWCHPTISSSVVLLLLPSIFPSIRAFSTESALHIRWQSIGVSASTSVLPKKIQDWFSLGWTAWIYLLKIQRTLKSLIQHHSSKASILWCSTFLTVQLSHP